jgi:glutathione S-transferase
MKFYDCSTAPSPRRVRIFAAEKGITLPTIQVDLRNNEQMGDAFRAINPELSVPVLELDDGRKLIDMVAICYYLEELHPTPPLFGRDPYERALVIEWQRRVERDGFYAVMEGFRNWARGMKGRALTGPVDYEQIPELAERGRVRVGHFFRMLENRLADNEFLVGRYYSIADITAFISVEFARSLKMTVPEDAPHLRRWYDAMAARPSAAA